MSGAGKDAAWVVRMGRHGVQVLAVVLVLALVFTMVNVQQFAAQGQPVRSFEWWISWLLDPMASLTMAAAIVFEGLLADYGKPKVPWLIATKWYAGIATWGMNIWTSLVDTIPSGMLLHSVAPGLVLLLAEAAPRVRRAMAEIVIDAERDAKASTVHDDPEPVPLHVASYEPVVGRPSWVAPPKPPGWARPPVVPVPVVVSPEPEPSAERAAPGPVAEEPAGKASTPDPVRVQVIPWPADNPTAGPLGNDELDVEVARILRDAAESGGKTPGRRVICDALGDRATPYRVRMSLQRVGEPTRVLSLNGAGSSAGGQQVHGSGGR